MGISVKFSPIKDASTVHFLDKKLSLEAARRLHSHLAVGYSDLDIGEGAEDIVQEALAVGAGNNEGGIAGCR